MIIDFITFLKETLDEAIPRAVKNEKKRYENESSSRNTLNSVV
jgi:hypothetical protein